MRITGGEDGPPPITFLVLFANRPIAAVAAVDTVQLYGARNNGEAIVKILRLAAMILSLVTQMGTAGAQWGNYFIGPVNGLFDSGQAVEPANTFVLVENTRSCASNSNTCVAFIPLTAFADGNSQSSR